MPAAAGDHGKPVVERIVDSGGPPALNSIFQQPAFVQIRTLENYAACAFCLADVGLPVSETSSSGNRREARSSANCGQREAFRWKEQPKAAKSVAHWHCRAIPEGAGGPVRHKEAAAHPNVRRLPG